MVACLPQRCLKISWTSPLFYWLVTSPHGAAWLNDYGWLSAQRRQRRAAVVQPTGAASSGYRHRPGTGKGDPVTRWPGFRAPAPVQSGR
jgi:hypothetical protein